MSIIHIEMIHAVVNQFMHVLPAGGDDTLWNLLQTHDFIRRRFHHIALSACAVRDETDLRP